jgi:regulator of protease activity HflC (stomatin/prohibitin superfamily)
MVNAEPQTIITKDKLNAQVDAQVYFKVKQDEESVKASQYNVFDYKYQIVNLARTTLRNIIGTLNLNEANSDRNRINNELMSTLRSETANWGIEVVRTELKEIDPPKDVQDTMNKVVKAENEKQAAIDYATATETQADGQRRAAIKNADGQKQALILQAEGQKQSQVLIAEGQAKAFELINQAFIGNAQVLKKLETVQAALQNNTKYVIDAHTGITNVIAEQMAGIIPVKENKE